jgi:predicted negative regulator of RcsB-dependent stress response
MRPFRMALLPLVLLSAACAPQPLPRRAHPARIDDAAAPGRAAVPAEASDRLTTLPPSKFLEEGALGETAQLTPAAEAQVPTPTPQEVASNPPAAVSETVSQPESMLTHISSTTPPNVAAALRLIEDGRQQMDQGRYDRALDRFERAVAVDPANAYGYYFLAQLHFQTKKYDQAVAFASRAVVLSARSDRVLMGRSYGLEGAAYEAVGRYPDARKAYEKAVEADPNNLAARVGIARLNPQ